MPEGPRPHASPETADWKRKILSALDPRHTALIVVDLQNDFCSPRGALALRGSDVGPCTAVAERVAGALPDLRGIASTVAFFRLVYDPTEMSSSQRERLLSGGKPAAGQEAHRRRERE